MTRASIACAAILAALLAGCADRIDPSTPESTAKSIEELQKSLSPEKRDQFSAALAVVVRNALGGPVKEVGDSPEGRARVRTALKGKTADDIIAEAARIKEEESAAKAKP